MLGYGSVPLDGKEVIKSLSHDSLLSLCSTEMKQLGYLVHQTHPDIFRKHTMEFKPERTDLYSKHRVSPDSQTNSLHFTDQKFKNLKSLPVDTYPIAPLNGNQHGMSDRYKFKFAVPHFVQLGIGLSNDSVNGEWVNLQALSNKDLLNLSPAFFLLRHNRPIEAWTLTNELYLRSKNADFLAAVKRTLKVVSNAYPMYFSTEAPLVNSLSNTAGNSVLTNNLESAVDIVFKRNIVAGVLFTRKEEVISRLVGELSKSSQYEVEFTWLYKQASRLSGFDMKMIRRLITNARRIRGQDNPDFDDQYLFRVDWGPNSVLHSLEDMVVKIQDSAIFYANVTIEDVEALKA
ncbi:hypothetical protein IWQ62_002749 [Dispira parvispora]|uniref:Uncharacterized protein n=1 Tax=Dispira parvispora TaxID=1520584 RepID=A0A9W8AT58_9FUNG|nr:hypothetical protein IWQ62_002749 [Dispira parvispora]